MRKVFMLNGGRNMLQDIKRCPCCGGEANILRENFGKTVWVQCLECGLSTSRYDLEPIIDNKNGLEWALLTWNRRTR